jgi:DNA-binding response OmpR family regulator
MNENILLVEDEQGLRQTLTARLKKVGYVVDTAADGVEGFNKAMDTPFDLILLDVALPLRNGFDVCRDLRQAGLAAPIVMLTARTQTVDKVVGLKLGADDYVTKPLRHWNCSPASKPYCGARPFAAARAFMNLAPSASILVVWR